MEKEDKVRG